MAPPETGRALVLEKYAISCWDMYAPDINFERQFKLLAALQSISLRRRVCITEIVTTAEYAQLITR